MFESYLKSKIKKLALKPGTVSYLIPSDKVFDYQKEALYRLVVGRPVVAVSDKPTESYTLGDMVLNVHQAEEGDKTKLTMWVAKKEKEVKEKPEKKG